MSTAIISEYDTSTEFQTVTNTVFLQPRPEGSAFQSIDFNPAFRGFSSPNDQFSLPSTEALRVQEELYSLILKDQNSLIELARLHLVTRFLLPDLENRRQEIFRSRSRTFAEKQAFLQAFRREQLEQERRISQLIENSSAGISQNIQSNAQHRYF